MTGRSPTTDLRLTLLALIDPIARAARLVLLLDERQPEALRAEAITMRPERLFWTLTQLDDGLPLEICQTLVRATRLSRGRAPRPGDDAAERRSAETAVAVAQAWAVRCLAALPTAVAIAYWLTDVGPPVSSALAETTPVDGAAAPSWFDLPPIVGPPPGAAASVGHVARLIEWLAGGSADR